MERILIHPLAGVLSAYGIGLADVKAIREASWLKPLGEDFSRWLAALEAARAQDLSTRAFDPERKSGSNAAPGCAPRAATPRWRSNSAARRNARRLRGAAPQALRLCRGGEPIVDTLTVEAVSASAGTGRGTMTRGSGGGRPTPPQRQWTAWRRIAGEESIGARADLRFGSTTSSSPAGAPSGPATAR
jgi:5-oxoprolinase (ATP-hydrolysing)